MPLLLFRSVTSLSRAASLSESPPERACLSSLRLREWERADLPALSLPDQQSNLLSPSPLPPSHRSSLHFLLCTQGKEHTNLRSHNIVPRHEFQYSPFSDPCLRLSPRVLGLRPNGCLASAVASSQGIS